jgi:N-acetylglucosaminyl-diphospho-decaprenol L-rhamnosyltransferase
MDAVIVTHNSARDLQAQLACGALRRAFPRIVVVDNASTDGSPDVARRAGVEVIRRGVNDGLAAALNEGMRGSGSELVALLNPDVLLDDETLPHRLAGLFEDAAVGLAAPALILPGGERQDSVRRLPAPGELLVRRLTGARHGEIRADAATDVAWAVLAFVAVRRTAFEDVGGFDEGFHLYFEDVDFCVRLWSRGWRVRHDPALSARHEHRAASRRSLVGRAMRRHVRSAARFYALHPDLLFATGRRRLVRAARPGFEPA